MGLDRYLTGANTAGATATALSEYDAMMATLTPATAYMGAKARLPKDEKWQSKARKYDREGPGIVGASLDLPAATSTLATPVVKVFENGEWNVSEDPMLHVVLRMFRGRDVDQTTLIRRLIRTADGPGEGYLIQRRDDLGWFVQLAQTPAVTANRNSVEVRTKPGAQAGSRFHSVVEPQFVNHFLVCDPEWEDVAWSPLRRSLPDLERYRSALRVIGRNLDSQLAMNGIFWAKAVVGGSKWVDHYQQWAMRAMSSDDGVEAAVGFPMSTVEEPKWVDVGRKDHLDQMAVADHALKAYARGMDTPQQMLLEGPGSGNHWCMPDDTEAFVEGKGWRKQSDVQIGDRIWAMDETTGQGVWSPVVSKYVADVENEPMLDMRRPRTHSSLSTMGHRWLVQDQQGRRVWRTSETLCKSDRIPVAAPHAALPQESKFTDAFVELLGWYTTEGCCTYRNDKPAQISLSQSHKANPEDCATIRRILTTVFGPALPVGAPKAHYPAWTETQEDRGITIFRFNCHARDMILDVVPKRNKAIGFDIIDQFTYGQLQLFVQALIDGDGTQRTKTAVIRQAVKERIDSFEYACMRAGKAVRVREVIKQNGFKNDVPHWELNIKSRTVTMPLANSERTVTEWSGTIWCPKTEHGTWLARHDGRSFYTGNSDFILSDFYADFTMAPRLSRAGNTITCAHMRPWINALPSLRRQYDPEKVKVDFDDVRIRTKTDNTDRILAARTAGIANREAVAEAVGLRKDQIIPLPPEVDEYEDWIASRSPSPATLEAITSDEELPVTDSIRPGVNATNPGEPMRASLEVLRTEPYWDALVPG